MLTQSEIKKILHYEPLSGDFTWLVSPNGCVKAGDKLGHVHKASGGLKYVRAYVNGKRYRVHRLAWLWMTGSWPKNLIDHIDGDGMNNSWTNLRDVTNSQNMRNTKIYSDNSTGHPGVYFCKQTKKWRVRIQTDPGIRKSIGYFDSLEDAKAARLQAEKDSGYHENHGREAT